MKRQLKYILSTLLLMLFSFSSVCHSQTKIAVLDFELNDITSLPYTAKEIIRTASIKPLLEQALVKQGEYKIIHIPLKAQKYENAGFGYLFRFHDVAAKLADKFNADWIIVGQHSKPSFLFSYLIVHMVNVKTGKLVAKFDIELKGNHQKVTRRGTRKLSRKIDKVINNFGKKEKT